MFILLIVLLIVGIVLFVFLKNKTNFSEGKVAKEEVWPFASKGVLTINEQPLYFKLCEVCIDHIVLVQVNMSSFLEINKKVLPDYKKHSSWKNKINQKSVDFLICNKDFSVVCAIELDDSSHNRHSRKTADESKNKALASAGIKLLRWTKKSMPSSDEMKKQIFG